MRHNRSFYLSTIFSVILALLDFCAAGTAQAADSQGQSNQEHVALPIPPGSFDHLCYSKSLAYSVGAEQCNSKTSAIVCNAGKDNGAAFWTSITKTCG